MVDLIKPTGIICDMDINTYLDQFKKDGGKLTDFAAKANMSLAYLGHIRSGRKKKFEFKIVMGLITASDGQISLKSLRPDLFPKGRVGKRNLELLRKAAS